MNHPTPAPHIPPAGPAPAGIEMPRALPFLLNVILAGGLGGYLGGWAGALVGMGALLALLAGVTLAAKIPDARATLAGASQRIWMLIRPLVALVLLPPVALLSLGISLGLFIWERAQSLFWRGRARPTLAVPGAPTATLGAVMRVILGLFSAEALPLTAVNALLLLVLGSVAIGIEVAFYVALAAVPVLICTLVMLAIDSSREPEDGPAKG